MSGCRPSIQMSDRIHFILLENLYSSKIPRFYIDETLPSELHFPLAVVLINAYYCRYGFIFTEAWCTCLLQIEEKYNIPALKIKNIFKRSRKG